MLKKLFAAVVLSVALACSQSAYAASIRVSPTIIEISPPAAASTVRLYNQGGKAVSFQVRVFRWSQDGGADHLTETDSVVASPPIANLAPGKSQVVRIVRVSKAPIQGEESYRILVDEIPDRRAVPSNAVTLAVRHSIPVFFGSGAAGSASLDWSVEQADGALTCVVHNRGEQRVRLASLRLTDPAGNLIAQRDGLVGYVLGQSSVSLPISRSRQRRLGDSIEISALTENGPIRATGKVVARD